MSKIFMWNSFLLIYIFPNIYKILKWNYLNAIMKWTAIIKDLIRVQFFLPASQTLTPWLPGSLCSSSTQSYSFADHWASRELQWWYLHLSISLLFVHLDLHHHIHKHLKKYRGSYSGREYSTTIQNPSLSILNIKLKSSSIVLLGPF